MKKWLKIRSTRWTDKIGENRIISSFINKLFYTFLSGIRKFRSSKLSSTGTVVVIALHRLGDAVFTIPSIREIKKHYSNKFVVVCYPETKPIYELEFAPAELVIINKTLFRLNGRLANKKARRILGELNPEIIFDLTGVMTSASLIYLSRAREIYGLCRPQFRGIYDKYINIRSKPHIMDIYLDAVKNIFPVMNSDNILFQFPSTSNYEGEIIIHPLAGWKAKEWGINKFIQLAQKLAHDFKLKFIFPRDTVSNDVKIEMENKNINWVETNSIEELINILKSALVYIGNDSGPAYIASFLGISTFTIFGPTNPLFHLPFGSTQGYIQSRIKCIPKANEKLCFTNGGREGCPSFECMHSLSVNEVFEKVESFIKTITNNKAIIEQK